MDYHEGSQNCPGELHVAGQIFCTGIVVSESSARVSPDYSAIFDNTGTVTGPLSPILIATQLGEPSIQWSRISEGVYHGELAGAFPLGTKVSLASLKSSTITTCARISDDEIAVYTGELVDEVYVPKDGLLPWVRVDIAFPG